MSERLAFVSMSAGLATGGEGAGRGRSLGAVDLNQPRHTLPESILQIQGGADPGGHFLKGQSGNLADWPPGSQDRAALAAELNGELEAPTRKAVALPATAIRGCCGSASIASQRRATRVRCSDVRIALYSSKATAARVKRSSAPTQTSPEVFPAKDTRMPCGVKQMLELKRTTPSCPEKGTCFPFG
jgi:hypothetical protein